MSIDLEKGLAIKIEGELGKYQTLPIEYLIKIAQSLQDLVFAVASADISSGNIVDLNNFKIELCGYSKGSAIPQFIFSPRVINLPLHEDISKQRNQITNSVDNLLQISNNSDYTKLIELYPDGGRRNKIVENVFEFTNSFDNSPTSFGNLNRKGEFVKSYSLHKLRKETKQKLLTEIQDTKLNIEPEEYSEFREILVTKDKHNKRKSTIISSIKKDGHSLSYSPDYILVNNRKYVFTTAPISLFQKEDGHYVIKNELLDIYAVGESEDEVERDFNEEFDYLYQRLNSLSDNEMTTRLKTIKTFINYFVKDVGSW